MRGRGVVGKIASDTDAFEVFYREHFDAVRRFVVRRVGDPHLAADVIADVFVAALSSATAYRPEQGEPIRWLYGVARNVVAAERRRSARERMAVRRVSGRALLDADDLADLIERIDAEAASRELYEAMDRLSDDDRGLLELVALDGLATREAARIVGLTQVTARVRLHRARRVLRERLAHPYLAPKSTNRCRGGVTMSFEDRLLTELKLPRVASGKVREIFGAGDHLLMVATDRISVFDVVLPTPIPGKGAVLAGLSQFWFDRTRQIVNNHLVAWRLSEFPPEMRSADLVGRAQLVRKAEMIPLECVVRGYITGSGWKDYKATGEVCGHTLPAGLLEAQQLPEPLFTPSTKALTGHDENISVAQAKEIVGDGALVDAVADVAIRLYEHARDYSASRGIILADTKYEFGLVDGELTVCDELFTPDSSRYWPADEWVPGSNPPSFDKQFVRDYAETVNWNKSYPGPELPDEVVAGTTARYREAYERVTGVSFDTYMKDAS
jgi:phosphoribosylaminoimidazole-succinocarboxamide synthase